jgi:hypothetical protein
MRAKQKQRSCKSLVAIYAGAVLAGFGGLAAVLALTAHVSHQHRRFAVARVAPSEQTCLTENTVQNMPGQVFVYVKELCRHVAELGPSPFTDCVFSNRSLMASEEGVPLIRARCEAISGGSSIEN